MAGKLCQGSLNSFPAGPGPGWNWLGYAEPQAGKGAGWGWVNRTHSNRLAAISSRADNMALGSLALPWEHREVHFK